MDTVSILNDPHTSLLIINHRRSSEIVVAAPHHAPLGTKALPCDKHLVSDENAGLVAQHLATILDCHSIIASNYIFDVNKCDKTDYYRAIDTWNPTILVEIHGHGGKKATADIEISSGSASLEEWSRSLAEGLKEILAEDPRLGRYSVCGEFNRIHFTATKSATIISDKWLAFHLELPKSIRATKEQCGPFLRLWRSP